MKIKTLLAVTAAFIFCAIGVEVSAQVQGEPTAWQGYEVQRGIKRANEGVVALGIFQIVLTGLGTFGVLWSLQMSRAALLQARLSSEIQRDVAREELRGYLSAEVPIVERFDAKGIRVTYNLRNVGGTPVKNVRMWSYADVIAGKSNKHNVGVPDVSKDKNPRTIPPGGVVGFAADKLFSSPSNFIQLELGMDTLVTAYLFSYEDIFGHERFVGYSEVRRGAGLSFRTMNSTFAQKLGGKLDILPPIPSSLQEAPRVVRECPLAWLFRLAGTRT